MTVRTPTSPRFQQASRRPLSGPALSAMDHHSPDRSTAEYVHSADLGGADLRRVRRCRRAARQPRYQGRVRGGLHPAAGPLGRGRSDHVGLPDATRLSGGREQSPDRRGRCRPAVLRRALRQMSIRGALSCSAGRMPAPFSCALSVWSSIASSPPLISRFRLLLSTSALDRPA